MACRPEGKGQIPETFPDFNESEYYTKWMSAEKSDGESVRVCIVDCHVVYPIQSNTISIQFPIFSLFSHKIHAILAVVELGRQRQEKVDLRLAVRVLYDGDIASE